MCTFPVHIRYPDSPPQTFLGLVPYSLPFCPALWMLGAWEDPEPAAANCSAATVLTFLPQSSSAASVTPSVGLLTWQQQEETPEEGNSGVGCPSLCACGQPPSAPTTNGNALGHSESPTDLI